MKRRYIAPDMELNRIDFTDIITTSDAYDGASNGENEGDGSDLFGDDNGVSTSAE
ncbi:MAG: hypothetical protein IJX38_06120 [Clostridia bacterium]|nr:hypothetical protein [Clostridia bacterium]